MARLFISQERLDAWTGEKRVQVEGDIMTLADDGRSFKIRPAVRFVSVAGGDEDLHDLLDKVKEESTLEEMGAELYLESVIVGGGDEPEVAYDVQSGFIGDPLPRED
jgi:hypothetical protein